MVKIVIVTKSGECSEMDLKNYNEEELFKKCNFRKSDGFKKQQTWAVKCNGEKYNVALYARTSGKHNVINKFEFPPPVDTVFFYGNCALVNFDSDNNVQDLKLEQWHKVYAKLFGGFENLTDTAEQDETEIDELANVPAKYKTKEGFLKDGFVVDNDSDELQDNTDKTESELESNDNDEDDDEDEEEFEDNGSELAPEEYSYSSDED